MYLLLEHYIFSNLEFIHYTKHMIFKFIPKEYYTTSLLGGEYFPFTFSYTYINIGS